MMPEKSQAAPVDAGFAAESLDSTIQAGIVTLGKCVGDVEHVRSTLERPLAAVRVTATGRTLATITPPKPYTSFSGVVSAYDDRTFVLVAWGPNHPPAPRKPRRSKLEGWSCPSRYPSRRPCGRPGTSGR